jgi:hypothetical protein
LKNFTLYAGPNLFSHRIPVVFAVLKNYKKHFVNEKKGKRELACVYCFGTYFKSSKEMKEMKE